MPNIVLARVLATGKARSSQNSFKHGLYSKYLVLPDEDPAELEELRASLRAEHQPANTTEDILVNELAEHFWRLRRMRDFEATGLQPQNLNGWLESGLLVLIQRNMASAERSFHKALTSLRQLQKDRGFVPSNSVGQTVSAVCQREPAESVGQTVSAVCQGSSEPPNGFVSQNAASRKSSTGFVSQNFHLPDLPRSA
jgi:hypothetical protein